MISFKFAACCDYLERDGWEMQRLDDFVLFHKRQEQILVRSGDGEGLEDVICKIKASEAANKCCKDIKRIEKEMKRAYKPHEPAPTDTSLRPCPPPHTS